MRLRQTGKAITLLSLLSSLNCAWAGELTGTVIGVSDGDTISVLSNGHSEKIRLVNIDCPEKKQPFGQKAKQYCSDLCFGKLVEVIYVSKDKYKRIIGRAKLPNGNVLNEELVKAGMAWCYVKYCKIPSMYVLERLLWREKARSI